MKCEIRELDPENHKDVATITRLHLELLWWGPMARLGELFLREFCYTVLLRDGLMRAALYEVDGQPAAFMAYTDRSITYHRSAIKKHFIYVVYLMVVSIIRSPRVIFRLPKAIWLMSSRRREQNLSQDPLAEILAIGVLSEYRNPAFLRRTGLRISEELVRHAASHFRRLGLKEIRMIVDADNKAALMLYHSLGARFEPYKQAGKQAVHVWLDLGRDF